VTSTHPGAGEPGEQILPSDTNQPGDHVNPPIAGPLDPVDQITEARPACPCHDALDRPDEAAVTINAAELARLGELLTDIDAFLRCGHGVAERLADFYTHRGRPHPRFAAANLIDAVGFAALTARRLSAGGRPVGGRS
jgi:hypothetical protein